MKRLRTTIAHTAATGSPVKLQLGTFDLGVDGWINTDITPHLFIAEVPGLPTIMNRLGALNETRLRQHSEGIFDDVHYLDVSKRFPIPDACVDAIFHCHMLEHLVPEAAKVCVAESLRVLKPGGVLRIGVPDLDIIVSRYDPTNPDVFVDGIFEAQQKGKNRHYWMYNELSLTALLREVGFTDITRRAFQQGTCPDLELLDNRPDSTLFVEAIR